MNVMENKFSILDNNKSAKGADRVRKLETGGKSMESERVGGREVEKGNNGDVWRNKLNVVSITNL